MKRTRNTTPMKILQRLLVTLLLSLGLWGSAAALAQTITYFHTDISGSPMVATDEAGEVVWKELYSPYGDKIERALASNSNRIGYHGHSHDDHSGLSYMGARYYDPVLGRFMGVDPVSFVETNLHSANRYAYANNNPYRFVDPDGRSPIAIELAKDGGIVGGVVCGPICGGVGAVAGLGLGLWGTYEANKLLSEGSKGDEEAEGGDKPVDIVVPGDKYPESADHIRDAQSNGQPDVLTLDRGGAKNRRRDAMNGQPVVPGQDRDEYPPALTAEGGSGASVRPVSPSDNRGAGACIGAQCRGLPDGTRIRIIPGR